MRGCDVIITCLSQIFVTLIRSQSMGNQPGAPGAAGANNEQLAAKGIKVNPGIQRKLKEGGHAFNSSLAFCRPAPHISLVAVKVIIRGDRETGKSGQTALSSILSLTHPGFAALLRRLEVRHLPLSRVSFAFHFAGRRLW